MTEEGDGRNKLSFLMQIGLTREQVNVDGELTINGLKDIACAFVDRKVRAKLIIKFFVSRTSI